MGLSPIATISGEASILVHIIAVALRNRVGHNSYQQYKKQRTSNWDDHREGLLYIRSSARSHKLYVENLTWKILDCPDELLLVHLRGDKFVQSGIQCDFCHVKDPRRRSDTSLDDLFLCLCFSLLEKLVVQHELPGQSKPLLKMNSSFPVKTV